MKTILLRGKATLLFLLLLTSLSIPALAADETTHAYYWHGSTVVEGRRVESLVNGKQLHEIVLNGNVYFPMQTVGEWAGAEVVWEPGTRTASFYTGNEAGRAQFRSAASMPPVTDEDLEVLRRGQTDGFDVTLLPNAKVFVRPISYPDREIVTYNAQGQLLCPILYQDVVYLPARTAAQVGGFSFWLHIEDLPLRDHHTLYLYTQPSQAQLQAARDYVSQMDRCIQTISDRVDALEKPLSVNDEEYHQLLLPIRDGLLSIKDLSIPSSDTVMYEVFRLHDIIDYELNSSVNYDLREDLSTPADWRRPDFVDSMRTHIDLLKIISADLLTIINGMAEGMA